MAFVSAYHSEQITDFLFEGGSFPTYTNGLWLGFFRVSPTLTTAGTESSVMPRTRIDKRRSVPAWTPTEEQDLWQNAPIAFNGTFGGQPNTTTSAIIGNSHPFQTEAATADETGNLVSAGIFDAQTGGNLLYAVDHVSSATVRPESGQRIQVGVNNLAVQIPFLATAITSSYFATRLLRRILQEDGAAEMPSQLWLTHLSTAPTNPLGASLVEAVHTPRKRIDNADWGDPAQNQVRNDVAIVHDPTTTDEPNPLIAGAIYDSDSGGGESNNLLFHLSYAAAPFTPVATDQVRVPAQGIRFGVL